MTRPVVTFVSLALTGGVFAAPVLAQQPTGGQRPNACTILTRQEVKKLVPWHQQADHLKETEEPFGPAGSFCSYPGVRIFVGKYSQSFLDAARKRSPLMPVAGIGDEAFLHANGSSFIELYVKLGDRMVHVQKGIPFDQTFDSLKPNVLALGKALVAKLR